MSPARIILLFHLLVVLFALGASSLYMMMSIINRLRVRRVHLHWHRAGQRSFVLGVGYLLLTLVGSFYLASIHSTLYPWITGAYVLSGLFWVIGAYVASEVLVTEYAIVPQAGQLHRAVGWRQIIDYVAHPANRKRARKYDRYTFFYLTPRGVRKRLDLPVPVRHRKRFRALVHRKLDIRFDVAIEQIYGYRELDG